MIENQIGTKLARKAFDFTKIEETTDEMTIISGSTKLAIFCSVVAIIFAVLAAISALFLDALSGCLSILIFGVFAFTFARLAILHGLTIEVTLDKKSGKVIWQSKPWLGTLKRQECLLIGLKTSLENKMVYRDNIPNRTTYRTALEIEGGGQPLTFPYMTRADAHAIQTRIETFKKPFANPASESTKDMLD